MNLWTYLKSYGLSMQLSVIDSDSDFHLPQYRLKFSSDSALAQTIAVIKF